MGDKSLRKSEEKIKFNNKLGNFLTNEGIIMLI